ncbi:hypothetical protein EV714DRAFT_271081 [Schizophyllum commune]
MAQRILVLENTVNEQSVQIVMLQAANQAHRSDYTALLETLKTVQSAQMQVDDNRLSSRASLSCPPGYIVYYTDTAGNPLLVGPKIVLYSPLAYPHVRFWLRGKYLEISDSDTAKKQLKALVDKAKRDGTPKPHGQRYIEFEDGTVIDRDTAMAVRNTVLELYNELKHKDLAPGTWSQLPHGVSQWFYAMLEDKYNFLRFCADHWKAKELPSLGYPSWRTSHMPDTDIAKQEEAEVTPVQSAHKRRLSAHEKSKKSKKKRHHSPLRMASPGTSSASTSPLPSVTGLSASGPTAPTISTNSMDSTNAMGPTTTTAPTTSMTSTAATVSTAATEPVPAMELTTATESAPATKSPTSSEVTATTESMTTLEPMTTAVPPNADSGSEVTSERQEAVPATQTTTGLSDTATTAPINDLPKRIPRRPLFAPKPQAPTPEALTPTSTSLCGSGTGVTRTEQPCMPQIEEQAGQAGPHSKSNCVAAATESRPRAEDVAASEARPQGKSPSVRITSVNTTSPRRSLGTASTPLDAAGGEEVAGAVSASTAGGGNTSALPGSKRAKASKTSITCRNFYKEHWCTTVKGTEDEFKEHWKLVKDNKDLLQPYDDRARSAAVARKQAASTPTGGPSST